VLKVRVGKGVVVAGNGWLHGGGVSGWRLLEMIEVVGRG